MATFNIHHDQENSSALPMKTKENAMAPKRTVLRVINKNSEPTGDARLPNYIEVNTKKSNCVKGVEENGKHYPNFTVLAQKQKCKTNNQVFQQVSKDFKIFEENAFGSNAIGDVCKEKFVIKDGNKSRVLKDKSLDHEKPCCSKEIDIPSCITELPREPVVPSSIYATAPSPSPSPSPSQSESSSSSSSSSSPQQQQQQQQQQQSKEDNDGIEEKDFSQAIPMSIDRISKSESTFKLEKVLRKDEPSLNEKLFACEEYKTEIFFYLKNLQRQHRPRKNYMLKQPDISYSMRAILVDWLVEVVEEYRMKTETLYLAVSYIDRFLSYMSVVRAKLQLVGTAAMFIASKFEEIYPPDVKDFVFVTDDTYSKKQVLRMENLILKVLSFDLSTPTILYFLTYFLSNYPTTERVKYLAMYLCELTLLEADPFLEFLPSDVAASALIIARYTLEEEIKEEFLRDEFQKAIDYKVKDLMPCIVALDKIYKKSPNHPQKAIYEKYKSDRYRSVSSINPLNEDCSSVLMKKYLCKEMEDSLSQS